MTLWHLLADNAATGPAGGGEEAPWWAQPQKFLLFPLILLAMFFLFGSRGKQKDQKAMSAMLKGLKRGDRVVTIGGIIGTVVDVRDQDVLLKVDEGSNSKMRFERGAIKRVVSEDSESSAK